MIRSGKSIIHRVHAKNYIFEEAQLRLDEAVPPMQQQGLNALQVDSFEVKLYHKVMSTQICTCKQTEISEQHSSVSTSLPPNIIDPHSDSDHDIVIDYTRPLFGSKGESVNNLDYQEALDFADDDDEIDDEFSPRTSENLFSANSDCGICYRTGYVPGYFLYNQDRKVLTTHELDNSYGYAINQNRTPHVFEQVDKDGSVDLVLDVPRYFKSVKISIRNNHELLEEDKLYLTTSVPTILTLQELRYSAGSQRIIRVRSKEFTHVVLEFDLGVPPIRANIAQMNKSLDWTMLSTLGNLNIILPMTIREVSSSDYIYVPSRGHVLKVTDTPFMRTAKDKNIEVSANTRIVQPQEPVKNIHIGQFLA